MILLRARAEKGTLLILFFFGLFWKKAPSALRLCPYGRALTVFIQMFLYNLLYKKCRTLKFHN